MSIDWSKAPEGATHYFIGRTTSPWRDLSDENWRWWDSERGWQCDNAIGLNIDRSSKGFLERKGDRLMPRPPASPNWDSQGLLPPVGTICEFNGGESVPEDPWDPDLQVGDQVEIIAHFDGGNGDILAAFTFHTLNPNRGAVAVEQGRWGCFRSIRTAEQIAAEEHQKAIDELAADTDWILDRASCEAVIAAGYRKQVQP